MNFGEIVSIVLGVIGLVVLISILFAFPVKWCWNYVMPYLFEFKEITWGQAWCLSFLGSVFFKSQNYSSSN